MYELYALGRSLTEPADFYLRLCIFLLYELVFKLRIIQPDTRFPVSASRRQFAHFFLVLASLLTTCFTTDIARPISWSLSILFLHCLPIAPSFTLPPEEC